MARRSSIKDDLLNAPFGKPVSKERLCDADDCEELGEHRAPKSKQQLNEYYWFCIKHIQEYNKSWNFYEGMTPGEIESHRMADTTWQRPTWNTRSGKVGQASLGADSVADPLGILGNEADIARVKREHLYKSLTGVQKRGLDLLNLEAPCTAEEVKKAYKEMVKRYHPDLNQDDPDAEERLKEINEAFAALKKGIH